MAGPHRRRLPARPDWTARIKAAFDDGLRLVSGRLLPREDEGLPALQRWVLVAAVEVASLFGKIRPGNRDRATAART
nr:hypothetical protein GCM10017745_44140 [Saccharothrix mutabilis subsp. capreolus]